MEKVARDKFLVFGAPFIGEEEIDEVVDTLRSGWLGTGPKVARFEELFRQYVGAELRNCRELVHSRPTSFHGRLRAPIG